MFFFNQIFVYLKILHIICLGVMVLFYVISYMSCFKSTKDIYFWWRELKSVQSFKNNKS